MSLLLTHPYRARIDRELSIAIEKMGEPSPLRDACAYALLNGGKRLRPMLVYWIAEALGHKRDITTAALSVEYFHTASLIADDLPCMDNDDTRRNQPSLHKVFGESVALLASYTLVAAGYGGIYETNVLLRSQFPLETDRINTLTMLSLEAVSRCSGLQGATHGQFLDLFPPDQTMETILKIIYRKTGTLFEIAFVLGWLFGGGAVDRIEKVKQCARHLGIVFQIADDNEDWIRDEEQVATLNSICSLGVEKIQEIANLEMQGFEQSLHSLGLWTEVFQQFCRELRLSLQKVSQRFC